MPSLLVESATGVQVLGVYSWKKPGTYALLVLLPDGTRELSEVPEQTALLFAKLLKGEDPDGTDLLPEGG